MTHRDNAVYVKVVPPYRTLQRREIDPDYSVEIVTADVLENEMISCGVCLNLSEETLP